MAAHPYIKLLKGMELVSEPQEVTVETQEVSGMSYLQLTRWLTDNENGWKSASTRVVVIAGMHLVNVLHASGLKREGDDIISAALQGAHSLITHCHRCWPDSNA